MTLNEHQLAPFIAAFERIAAALERIADQGDNHLTRQEPDGETPPPRPVP
jgi:hypothetical protein